MITNNGIEEREYYHETCIVPYLWFATGGYPSCGVTHGNYTVGAISARSQGNGMVEVTAIYEKPAGIHSPGRCETCRWWEGGICTHPSMHNISDCIGNGAAVYNDGYSCGDLQTGHKFGCIHHEAKTGKD